MSKIKEEEQLAVPATSLKVAEMFGKQHKDVLKAIKNLEISASFRAANFRMDTYEDSRGREQPVCNLTYNGYMMLIMGFTGKEAARIKVDYIKRFNEMDSQVKRREVRRRFSRN